MVKHVILWKLKEELDSNERALRAREAKQALESLKGQIDGLLEIQVIVDGLESSNADMMLDSVFSSKDTLREYQVHPAHVEVANTYVRPYAQTRLCMDYDVQ